MYGFREIEFGLSCVEFLDLGQELLFSFNFLEEFVSGQHFIQNKSSAPGIALLIVRPQVNYFRCGVKWGAGAFGHLYLNVSGQAKVSDFQFFVFIE